MKKQWKNNGVNLNLLAEKIQNVYAKKGLKTQTINAQNKWKIHVYPGHSRQQKMMSITITGTPNNFTIETRATEYEDEAVKIGLSTSLFGGGYLIYSSIKAREKLEKLENEFWASIEEIIATLAKSAQN